MVRTAAVLLLLGAASAFGETIVVNTVGNTFVPADVTIQQGDTISWQLQGHHTSTSDDGLWNSGFVVTYARIFNEAGTFPYHCIPHVGFGMRGIIRVNPSKVATTTTLESSVNPSLVGEEVTFTATVFGGTPTGSITFTAEGSPLCSNVVISNATATCSTSSLTAGSHAIVATYSGDASFEESVSDPLTQIVSEAPPPAPAALQATAVSATEIALSWSMAVGATGYEVYRTGNRLDAYQLAATTTTALTALDTMRAPGTTYLYKVLAKNTGGSSPFSPVDAATTVVFADADLGGAVVKGVHVAELQTAVNAMRAAAGLGPMSFTDAPIEAGVEIRAVHIDELRAALDAARADIGLPPLNFDDPVLTGGVTVIRAIHATQLRNGTQ